MTTLELIKSRTENQESIFDLAVLQNELKQLSREKSHLDGKTGQRSLSLWENRRNASISVEINFLTDRIGDIISFDSELAAA